MGTVRRRAWLGFAGAAAVWSCGTGIIETRGGRNGDLGDAGLPQGGAGGNGPGTGGAPDVPPTPMVGKCENLGPVDKWERITPPGVDPKKAGGFGVLSVITDPVHPGTLLFGTDKQGLWKSTDCGATWAKANTGKNAVVLDQGLLWQLHIDPIEPNVMYAGSLYSTMLGLLKSTNAGTDWEPMFTMATNIPQTVEYGFLAGVALDPTNHKHVVVTFHANCKGPTGAGCMAESLDSGVSWRIFKNPVNGWLEAAGPHVVNATTFIYASPLDGVYFTGNAGASWEKVSQGGYTQMYRAKDGFLYMASIFGMRRSQDGRAWTNLMGGPLGNAVIGDGSRMFTSWTDSGKANYFTAPEADGSTWTKFTPPPVATRGENFAMDNAHHVLYVAHTSDGLWRMTTQ